MVPRFSTPLTLKGIRQHMPQIPFTFTSSSGWLVISFSKKKSAGRKLARELNPALSILPPRLFCRYYQVTVGGRGADDGTMGVVKPWSLHHDAMIVEHHYDWTMMVEKPWWLTGIRGGAGERGNLGRISKQQQGGEAGEGRFPNYTSFPIRSQSNSFTQPHGWAHPGSRYGNTGEEQVQGAAEVKQPIEYDWLSGWRSWSSGGRKKGEGQQKGRNVKERATG